MIHHLALSGWIEVVGIVLGQSLLFDELVAGNGVCLRMRRITPGMEQITQSLAVGMAVSPFQQAGTHAESSQADTETDSAIRDRG